MLRIGKKIIVSKDFFEKNPYIKTFLLLILMICFFSLSGYGLYLNSGKHDNNNNTNSLKKPKGPNGVAPRSNHPKNIPRAIKIWNNCIYSPDKARACITRLIKDVKANGNVAILYDKERETNMNLVYVLSVLGYECDSESLYKCSLDALVELQEKHYITTFKKSIASVTIEKIEADIKHMYN